MCGLLWPVSLSTVVSVFIRDSRRPSSTLSGSTDPTLFICAGSADGQGGCCRFSAAVSTAASSQATVCVGTCVPLLWPFQGSAAVSEWPHRCAPAGSDFATSHTCHPYF